MANDALKNYYNALYKNREAADIIPIDLVKYPNDRFQASLKHLCENWPQKEHVRVLEVGGGDGITAASLMQQKMPFSDYVMTDLSEPRVKAAQEALGDKRLKSAVLDLECDEADWPFQQGEQFDVVMMVALIEHLIDPISAMKRLRKHIAPGGFVYILTPNIARWVKRARLLAGQFPSTASKEEGLRKFNGDPVDLHDEGHLHYFTFASLERLLTQYAGYDSVQRCPYWEGTRVAPKAIEHTLANLHPGLFSELAVIARVA